MTDDEVPTPPTRRSMQAPARARHARPVVLEPAQSVADWATPLLSFVGVVLLVAAIASFATARWSEQDVAEAAAVAPSAVPLPAELPVNLEIPAIDVKVVVKPVGLTVDQELELPAFGETGWYRLGPSPGQDGHAVIAGHVDSRKGLDVFHRLHTVKRGQAIEVRTSTGALLTYEVDEVTRQSKESLPESRMWNSNGRPQLALITCGGKFDKKLRSYPDNVVVYATMSGRVDPQPARYGPS